MTALSTKHWHYEVEQTGCPRYVSKVGDSGRILSTFAEVFPKDSFFESMVEMIALANQAIGYDVKAEAAPTDTRTRPMTSPTGRPPATGA